MGSPERFHVSVGQVGRCQPASWWRSIRTNLNLKVSETQLVGTESFPRAALAMSHSTQTRLLKEFTAESKDPNPAIKELAPVNDDDLRRWQGWLQCIKGTPYEGMCRRCFIGNG